MLRMIVLLLALIGGWFLYHSYQQHQLRENMGVVIKDYSHLAIKGQEMIQKKYGKGVDVP